MILWEYSEQSLGNLKLCKTNSLVYSTTKLQGERERKTEEEPERNLEKHQPIPLYGPYLDHNLDKPAINKHL